VANTNRVQGLTPVRYFNGADWDGKGNLYYIDQTDSNAYYVGDPVYIQAGLDIARGLPTLTVGSAGAPCAGVILAVGSSPSATVSQVGGPLIDPTNLNIVYAPATKTRNYFALVADDPYIVFRIQEGGTGTLLTAAAANKNANFALAAPATGVVVSGAYLDNGTAPAVTATYNLKLLGLSQILDGGAWNTFGKYAKWDCLINNHLYRGTGILGV
jgi:hypothetical protein